MIKFIKNIRRKRRIERWLDYFSILAKVSKSIARRDIFLALMNSLIPKDSVLWKEINQDMKKGIAVEVSGHQHVTGDIFHRMVEYIVDNYTDKHIDDVVFLFLVNMKMENVSKRMHKRIQMTS